MFLFHSPEPKIVALVARVQRNSSLQLLLWKVVVYVKMRVAGIAIVNINESIPFSLTMVMTFKQPAYRRIAGFTDFPDS